MIKLLFSFSNIPINILFDEQCNMDPSLAKRDLGTTVNSYLPIVSSIYISGRLLLTIIMWAKKDLSA